MKKNKTETKTGRSTGLSNEELDRALLRIADLFDRALCPYVLLGETARSVKEGQIAGLCIDIGVRQQHLARSTVGMLRDVIRTLDDTGENWTFLAEGVPVRMKVIKRKIKYVTNPDAICYKYDDYLLPNPFEEYWKHRGLVK